MYDIQRSILMQVTFACKMMNNLSEAKAFLATAAKYANSIVQLDEIGYLQNEIKDYEGSVSTLHKCLKAANPEHYYPIRANLAKMYNHLNDPTKSIEMSLENQKEKPDDYDIQMELAFSYYLLGNYQKSEEMMRELASHENLPDNVKGRVLYNLGSYDMMHGEFKKGLRGFIEIGHQIGIWKHTGFDTCKDWDGVPVKGQTLFIHSEGGIGDELICVRFVKNVEALGMNPVWVTSNKDIIKVFNRNGIKALLPGEVTLRQQVDAVQVMAMFLPIKLDLDASEVWNGPYLKPDDKFIEKWKQLLPPGQKLAVKWTGNPAYDQDLHRSLPLSEIRELNFNGTKINLQLEKELFQDDMFNAGKYITSIEDTLALLSLCDYTVTSCTSVAHMLGSIGCPGVVCPPIAHYYTWSRNDGKSDWYGDNLHVIKQRAHKKWRAVFEKVQELVDSNS